MLLPVLVAVHRGIWRSSPTNGTAPLFPVTGVPPFSFVDLAGAAVLGLAAGGGAHVFAWILVWANRVAERGNAVVRVAPSEARCGAVRDRSWPHGSVAGPDAGLRRRNLTARSLTHRRDPARDGGLALACHRGKCQRRRRLVRRSRSPGALLGRAFGVAVGGNDSLFLVVGVAVFLVAGYRVLLGAVMMP
jgi:hypothetical protein